MPIIKSAQKKLRQDKKRTRQNLLKKNLTKDAIRDYRKNPTPAKLKKVFSLLDNTGKTNIFHPNKVARLKSRLSKLLDKRHREEKVKKLTKSKKSQKSV